ncbi:aminodeoxychorismate synthase component I [Streptomyces sp. NPDC006285]|uniref:aminodeoxychorismate synthase component I n=1 Tax=Streptomyces sp. NPDC006285 TaxID=3364742 RepID=UPI0036D0E7B9
MRTLLVDNYDSFTYNLFHYLSRVNGREPEVIRNDDPAWRPGLLDAFDNVVLSPGPGTPHRPADFGLCAGIAEEGRLPVLGVCLGHQGMALAHGARVGRAPEPRHGRTSAVRHDGTGLFEGLPVPLEVVRYHSLAVTDLPPELEATAWSPDGVLMALRHRTLPLWGVQFHPESIGTQEGHRLLANFGRLTERYGRPPRGRADVPGGAGVPAGTGVPGGVGVPCGADVPTGPAVPAGARVPAGLGVPASSGSTAVVSGSATSGASAPITGRGASGTPAATAAPATSDSPTAGAAPATFANPTAGADAAASGGPAAGADPATTGGPATDTNPATSGGPATNADPTTTGRPTTDTNPTTTGGATANVVPATTGGPTANVVPVASGGPSSAASGGPASGADPVTDGDGDVRRLRVVAVAVPVRWDAEVAFDTLFRTGDHPFWLDSSRPGGRLGQLSVMGDASGPLARIAEADVHAGTVTVTAGGERRTVDSPFLTWLENDLAGLRTEVPELPFDFALGWVGCLGYELKAECEGDAAHRSPDPDAVLVFADRALVLDHRTGTGHLLALAEDGAEEAARAWLADAAAALHGIAGRPPEPCADAPECTTGPVELRHDRDAYLKLIDVCQQEIAAGETYEVCLTNMAEADTDLDPWQAYRALRRVSAAPFAAFLHFGTLAVLSSSPERFLRIDRHGGMESKPIKGTRPRGATPEEDARLVEDLAGCEKDRAENLMIVDLVRHDLGRCAAVGSVVADPVFQVETYATVHQLVSTVRARLRPDSSPVAAVRAAFPGGSMTGAPKIRTMQIIDRLEGGPRGVYSGAIGYFSLTGAVDLSIVIRTVVLSGNRLRYGVGGAVIALSDPVDEFEETAVKATPLLRLLGARFPGREAPGEDLDRPGAGASSVPGTGGTRQEKLTLPT